MNRILLSITLLAGLLLSSACTNRQADNQSYRDAVSTALEQADLKGVTVTEDHDKNTITLGGKLHSDEAKAHAGEVAKSAAPPRTIANEISVQPVGEESQAKAIDSNLDSAIEKDYKAALISSRLDKQHIRFDAKNGVLTLKGSVQNGTQKQQAQKLAAAIPNVKQVVNEIDVRG
ncbi:MAG TPA: BON domain-containing protein [Candidatus Sulfotelmatobacter sp.]|nr:BON domain-containing protein [Candidatus Sulfotelmatobacter sp.]